MADTKYGVREICDVVLRAKKNMSIGNMTFEKDMPVLYFDSLKTSTMEGAATTVYAQGGKGNVRLIAWEGERTVTFTMEDALISPISFSVLSGAGLVEASDSDALYVHTTETTELESGTDGYTIELSESPALVNEGKEIFSYIIPLDDNGDIAGAPVRVALSPVENETADNVNTTKGGFKSTLTKVTFATAVEGFSSGMGVLVDYYVKRTSGVKQIEVTADKFAGSYYLEASTLWRDKSGVDYPAEFIIPNCKIQSNFTFTMAATGDPSTFTFTLDAFPGYLKFDKSKKVIAAIQVVQDTDSAEEVRTYQATATADNFSALASDKPEHDGDKFTVAEGLTDPWANSSGANSTSYRTSVSTTD